MNARLRPEDAMPLLGDADVATEPWDAWMELPRAMLDALDYGAMLLDPHGRPVLVNRCADDELRCGTCLRLVGAAVAPAEPACRRDWQQALATALEGHPALVPLDERQSRFASVACVASEASGPMLLVLVSRSGDVVGAAVRPFARLRGLTPTEGEVLAKLARGLAPSEVAARHRRSLCTVRTQVRSILAKLDVHALQSLVAEIARLPPMPGRRGPSGMF